MCLILNLGLLLTVDDSFIGADSSSDKEYKLLVFQRVFDWQPSGVGECQVKKSSVIVYCICIS